MHLVSYMYIDTFQRWEAQTDSTWSPPAPTNSLGRSANVTLISPCCNCSSCDYKPFLKDKLPPNAILMEYIPDLHKIDLSTFSDHHVATLRTILKNHSWSRNLSWWSLSSKHDGLGILGKSFVDWFWSCTNILRHWMEVVVGAGWKGDGWWVSWCLGKLLPHLVCHSNLNLDRRS